MKPNKILLSILVLLNLCSFSQNLRDKFVKDSISPFFGIDNKIGFDKLLKNIVRLEKDYNTYEPNYRYTMLLESSYNIGNFSFFKEQLSILVEKYGFQVAYMKETESYYKAIMTGELAVWFKEMYIEKHVVWLKNNFEKQIGLRKLNALAELDQSLNSYSHQVDNKLDLDSIQLVKNREIIGDFFLKNAGVLNNVANLNKAYPTAKTFALVQNPFIVVELHNLQIKQNFNRFYILFYDYYKKAYLNNDLTIGTFSNIDLLGFSHFGYQKFGLLTKEKVLYYLKDKYENKDFKMPIEDIKFSEQVKKEFKW